MNDNEARNDGKGDEGSRPSKLKKAWIVAIAVVLGTHIFVLLIGSIFDRLRHRGWSHYSTGSYGSVYVELDSEGNIWLGQKQKLKELTSYGDRAIRSLGFQSIESGYVYVTALEIDKGDRIWIGTNKGLNLYTPGQGWSFFTNTNSGLIDNSVQAIAMDGMDRVWVGTDAGLSVLSPDMTWQTYSTRNTTIPDDDINALAVDSVGRVWVGTQSGLGLIAPEGNWPDFRPTHSNIVGEVVTAIFVEEDDDIWVGTRDGLNKLSADGQWTQFNISGNYYSQQIYAITVDREGQVWVTTRRELLRLDQDGRWTIYNPEYTGLPYQSGEMEDLEVAEDGRILIGTDRGIAIFDEDRSTNLQVLKTCNSLLGVLEALRCLNLIAIAFLSMASFIHWRRGKRRERVLKPRAAEDSWGLLENAKRLLSEGKREEAIDVYLKAYREGSPSVQKLALTALEELGEVETF